MCISAVGTCLPLSPANKDTSTMTNVSVCVWLDRAEVIQVETNFQLNYVKQNDRVFSTTTNGDNK